MYKNAKQIVGAHPSSSMGDDYFFSSPFVKKDRGSVFDVDEAPVPQYNSSRKSREKRKKEEKEAEAAKELQHIIALGFECKIFHDDAAALAVEEEKHLIPWFGDTSLMVDRYDVRLLLDDRKLFRTNKKHTPTQEELDEEATLDYERYYDLEMYEEELEKGKKSSISQGSPNVSVLIKLYAASFI